VGVGEVVMEGHPAEPVGMPAVQQRIPVQSATKTFAITGTATTARRAAVDINKCNVCHGNLTLHGNNRTSRIEACVACHNTNATDINQRPKTGTTADNKGEESIDFKKLIHGIHGAEFSGAGPVIYGFGGSVNDFRGAVFPGVLNNCEACHNPGTYSASFPPAKGTTTSTETLADPNTYLRTTPITATCSACHATGLFLSHMRQNGGAFDVTQPQIDAAQ
jgi:OmcA/MtrC family decaheme c-type cytochrome